MLYVIALYSPPITNTTSVLIDILPPLFYPAHIVKSGKPVDYCGKLQ
jgi:hypothetical protein